MKITKLSIIISLVVSILLCILTTNVVEAAKSSETIDGRKGVFRLLSADINDQSDYFFRTSIEYFRDTELVYDPTNRNRDAYGTKANLGFGYALFPNLLLSASGGFRVSTLEVGNFKQSYVLSGVQLGATGTYDLSPHFDLPEGRLMGGASLQVDFSSPTRIHKGIGVQPRLMLTTDFSELDPVGVRAHLNLGFNPAKDSRYFNEKRLTNSNELFYRDFDYFAYQVSHHFSFPLAFGMEFPFWMITPAIEYHHDYVLSTKFAEQPKWVTVGVKTRPFPQKNVELFVAGDVGLSSAPKTANNVNPDTYAVPLWNAMLGFGISQFGKKPNEVAIDSRELNRTRDQLKERNELLAALKSDLAYNTVRGRVIDAETKLPMSNVLISFPESPALRSTETNQLGEFTRYFPNLEGSRIVFSKEGYADSTKFLALKPGESIRVDIELQKGGAEKMGDLQLTVTDAAGAALAGVEVMIVNEATSEENKATTDASGNLSIKLVEGDYRVEVRATGYIPRQDKVQIRGGTAVIRSYPLSQF